MSSKSSRFDGISLAGIANVQTRDAIMKLNKNFNTLLNGVKSGTISSGGSGGSGESGGGGGGGSGGDIGDYVSHVNGIKNDVTVAAGSGIAVSTEGSTITISLTEKEEEGKEPNCNDWSGEYDPVTNEFTRGSNSWSDGENESGKDGESGGAESENQAWSEDDCRAVNNDFK